MGFSIEVAPSGRATCKKCKKKIKQFSGRLNATSQHGAFTDHNYFCRKCGLIILNEELKQLQEKIFALKHFKECRIEEEI